MGAVERQTDERTVAARPALYSAVCARLFILFNSK